MVLNLEKVQGFECFDSLIRITDEHGRTLYYFNNPERKRITFNLPSGTWYSENHLTKLKRPLKYISPPLPAPTKRVPLKMPKYSIEPNPHKCSVNVRTGEVIIDPHINAKDIPFLMLILFHEAGHNYYEGGGIGENYCDIFAATQMLKRGYNPSQINYAQEFCLGERSLNRKDYLFNFLKKVKVYE